jgi:hypothetical protein
MLPSLFGLLRSPRSRAASSWTEKRLRYLRRRWSEGARAREIGAELGVTANAVIAKIHRLGIARLSPYGGAPGRRLALQNSARVGEPDRPGVPDVEPPSAAVVPINSLPRPLPGRLNPQHEAALLGIPDVVCPRPRLSAARDEQLSQSLPARRGGGRPVPPRSRHPFPPELTPAG